MGKKIWRISDSGLLRIKVTGTSVIGVQGTDRFDGQEICDCQVEIFQEGVDSSHGLPANDAVDRARVVTAPIQGALD